MAIKKQFSRRALIQSGAFLLVISPLIFARKKISDLIEGANLIDPDDSKRHEDNIPQKNWGELEAIMANQIQLHELVRNENPLGSSLRANQVLLETPLLFNRYAFQVMAVDLLKEKLASDGKLNPASITLAPGSTAILWKIIERLSLTKKKLITSSVEYARLIQQAKSRNIEVHQVSLNHEHQVDLDAMSKVTTQSGDIIYLSNPHLPFGGFHKKESLQSFLRKVSLDCLVIIDEAYIHYLGDDWSYISAQSLIEQFPNLVVVRTFSKIYGLSAMRIGYQIQNKNSPLNMKLATIEDERGVSAIGAAMAMESLSDDNQVYLSRIYVEQMKQMIKTQANQLGLDTLGNWGNYICIDFKRDSGPIRKKLNQQGFAFDPNQNGPYLRLSVGSEDELNRFFSVLPKTL